MKRKLILGTLMMVAPVLMLVARGTAEKDLREIEAEVAVAVDEATEEARNSPLPDEKTAMTEVWSNGGSEWRN